MECSVCGGRAVAQWQRRLTEAEFAEHLEWEGARRRVAVERALAAPRPAPEFGSLPSAQDCTRAVSGCAEHAVHIDLAAMVHGSACGGGGSSGCDCGPEQPVLAPMDSALVRTVLPSGWVVQV